MAPPTTDISQLDPDGSYTYADYLGWKFTELVELIRGRVLRKMSAPTSAGKFMRTSSASPAAFFTRPSTCAGCAAAPSEGQR